MQFLIDYLLYRMFVIYLKFGYAIYLY